jgi:PPOX class probable F420-dependent enzyme
VARLDLSLTPEELDRFLTESRTVRVATVGPGGEPHVVPLWFVWHDGTLFVNTTRGNRTVRNAELDPRAAATVDDGERYEELRGVVLHGLLEPAEGDSRLAAAREAMAAKYFGGNRPHFEGWRNRMYLRLAPQRISSWDFRKIPDALARREALR